MPKTKDSESESEEYETYEYETETGDGEEEEESSESGEEESESGEEESSEEEEESSEEESSSSKDDKKKEKKDDKKAKKSESSEESESSEYESESESSEKKKDDKKDDKKADKKESEDSSEYEYESEYESSSEEEDGEGSSEYEYEYESSSDSSSSSSSSSSSEKPAAKQAAAAKKTDVATAANAGGKDAGAKDTGAAAAGNNNNKAAAASGAAASGAAGGAVAAHAAGGSAKSIHHDDRKKEALWWPARHFGEFLGTFGLCWAIDMTRATLANASEVPQSGANVGGIVAVALVSAFVYAAMLASFGRLSGGHFNPAVTFTFMFIGEISPVVGIVYILWQFAGAVLAAALTWGLLPPTQTAIHPGIRFAAPIACAWWYDTDVIPEGAMHPDHVCTYQAFGAEITGTLLLIIAILLAGVANYGRGETYVSVGFALGAATLATLPISNALLNPARAVGNAIFAHAFNWFDIWVWIIGPVTASIVAVPLWFLIFKPLASAQKKAGDKKKN